MCHHVGETFPRASRERPRSEATDDPTEEPRESTGGSREESVDDPDGSEEPEPPVEPRAPADD